MQFFECTPCTKKLPKAAATFKPNTSAPIISFHQQRLSGPHETKLSTVFNFRLLKLSFAPSVRPSC